MTIKRGDIFLVNLEPTFGSEQGKIRPCLVVQNDISNKYSPNTIIVPFTSSLPEKDYPTTIIAEPKDSGLEKTSAILCSQPRTVSVEDRILKKLGILKPCILAKVDEALRVSLALE